MAGFMDAMKQPNAPQGDGMAQPETDMEDDEPEGQAASEEEERLLEQFMDKWGDVVYSDNGGMNPMVLENLRGDFDPRALQAFQKAEPPVKPEDPRDAVAMTAVLLMVLVDSQLGYQQKANAEGGADTGPPEPAGEAKERGEGPGMEEPGEAGERETPAQETAEEAPSYSDVLWQAGQTSVELLADAAEKAGAAEMSEDDLGYAFMRAADLYRYASPNIDPAVMQRALADGELMARQGKIRGMPKGEEGKGDVLPGLPGGPAMQEA